MRLKEIDKCVIIKLKEWLRLDGVNFFKEIKEKYGE
jgi:hypothetical protein